MAPRKKPGIEVREAADGTRTYRIRWRQDGRNFSHSYSREKEAIHARAQIIAAGNVCHCPDHTPRADTPGPGSASSTFGQRAHRHIAALTGVGPGYRARFGRELELHLAPFLDRPLDGITEIDVREWIVGMENGSHSWLHKAKCDHAITDGELPCNQACKAQRSPTTIRRLLVQAGSVMTSAQDEGLAARNPFRKHRVGRRDRDQHTEMTVLTHEEWAGLQSCLPAGVYRDLATTMVGTGMRWGEVAALGPGHVDPFITPPVLHVARAWQDDGENGYQLGTPKSRRSRRTLNFSGAVLEALIPHLSAAGEFVFTTPGGQPLRHSNFYNRVWVPAVSRFAGDEYDEDGKLVKRGSGKRPRIHDLRHTYASWLISDGMDIAAVSRRLGHETTALTVDTYYHLLPKTEADALAILERAMPSRPS